jgi:hypothetical protein
MIDTAMVETVLFDRTTAANKTIDLPFGPANEDNGDNRPRPHLVNARPLRPFIPAVNTSSARSSRAAEHR